tara:strand:+ start:123 stop:389 length:267 start_codon:yes stop_codon:yes gene_type:complete
MNPYSLSLIFNNKNNNKIKKDINLDKSCVSCNELFVSDIEICKECIKRYAIEICKKCNKYPLYCKFSETCEECLYVDKNDEKVECNLL